MKGILVLVLIFCLAMIMATAFKEVDFRNVRQPVVLPEAPDFQIPNPGLLEQPSVQVWGQDAREFAEYGAQYLAAYKNHTITAHEEKWKGKQVAWCGRITNLWETGTDFYMEPLSKMDRVSCAVMYCDPGTVRGLKVGQVVHIKGKISSAGIGPVLVTGG